MKNRILILVTMVIILVTIQACSAESSVQPTTVIQEATMAEEQTNPTVTSIPSQEAGGIDIKAGPETIDLANPVLYVPSTTPAYTFEATVDYLGVTTTGAKKEVSLSMTEETQTLPQNTHHFLVVVTGGVGGGETVILGDQGYSDFQGTCFQFSASSALGQDALKGMPILQELIKGQAQRVETGIEINGFVSDKYELTSENMVEDDELINAFVYVTRDGGFITVFESQGRTKTDYQGFDINQLTDFSITHNYIPVEDGSLVIAIPPVCAK